MYVNHIDKQTLTDLLLIQMYVLPLEQKVNFIDIITTAHIIVGS